ncbi:hypothetical protein [Nitrosomonas communis]|uniref:hypothetical protein n=1 Tax=Nitrosomonas communis TaxID=44574 RepID=UPI001160C9A7|nr:hypothetical protein [Nitrosomonas communis]
MKSGSLGLFPYALVMADYTMWIDHRYGESAGLSPPLNRAVKQEEKRKRECQMKGLTPMTCE